ncbi:hypothetical protein AALO_G00020730 [Alosa alosa]|uniref:Serine/threonine-protein kinase CHK1 n=1 Tax=Alosa alosa TaxID=278164 RepID=A0AAV6H9B5_9TELE|nr:serine/threonine-protein kinase Chk1 [Alosa alosa]KAG5283893.1 hypothetical protein AALO_G00020730 [Alosa alosa]
MAVPFVQDWDVVQDLGEGAYGVVRLLMNRKTDEAVAVKVLDTQTNSDCLEVVKKEVCIHKLLTHINIVRFFGHRNESNLQYIFLEYCSGGALFDRIEPDIGMPEKDAHRFFQELIAGVEYLHGLGITHRDIKPENLLLDDKDTLKIADFGLATVFRHRGRERLLGRACGSLPYIAPEVMSRSQFRAQPADTWSCGIVLTTMLTGELPWDQPSDNCQEYADWLQTKTYLNPWKKIDAMPLCLLTKILLHDPKKRIAIAEVKKHPWICKKFRSGINQSPNKILASGRHLGRTNSDDRTQISSSQPEPQDLWELTGPVSYTDGTMVSFSQPVCPDHMLLGSQLLGTPGASQNPWQRLIRRMTRITTALSAEEASKDLKAVCISLGHTWKQTCTNQVTVSTNDRRNNKLIYKVYFLDVDEGTLVDFRLSRGDGLEFKRYFVKIKEKFCHIQKQKASVC